MAPGGIPRPESCTQNSIRSPSSFRPPTSTAPSSVNFSALVLRLRRIRESATGCPIRRSAAGGARRISSPFSTAIGWVMSRRARTPAGADTVANLVARIDAWWVMVGVLAAAFLLGRSFTLVVFGLMAYFALREFVTLTPTRSGDRLPGGKSVT